MTHGLATVWWTPGAGGEKKEPMSKIQLTQKTNAVEAAPVPQAKRYDEAFKRQAVENWIKTGKPGTQIARELGVSYPCLKNWKRRYYGNATPERADLAAENRPSRRSWLVCASSGTSKKNAGQLHRTVQER